MANTWTQGEPLRPLHEASFFHEDRGRTLNIDINIVNGLKRSSTQAEDRCAALPSKSRAPGWRSHAKWILKALSPITCACSPVCACTHLSNDITIMDVMRTAWTLIDQLQQIGVTRFYTWVAISKGQRKLWTESWYVSNRQEHVVHASFQVSHLVVVSV